MNHDSKTKTNVNYFDHKVKPQEFKHFIPSEMITMATKQHGEAKKVKGRKACGLPRKKEHMLVTRDGNVIKGPIFEKMIQTLIH